MVGYDLSRTAGLRYAQPAARQDAEPVSRTITYTYDPLYRLTEANYSNNDYFHYTYDAVGNRLQQESFVNSLPSTVNYEYDIANRLVQVGNTEYTWDANGNLLDDGVNQYTYDAANRLIALSNQQSAFSFGYNGLGDRLQQIASGQTTNYTLDLNAGLTQVLDDGTDTYLYGMDRIAQVDGVNTDYYLGDALGSVRQMADDNAGITLAQSYDPYGDVISSQGSGASVFAYTGEQVDQTGLTFLRARYYTPEIGGFVSKDTWGGSTNLPISFDSFLYAYDNPINYVDPAGTDPIPDWAIRWAENLRAKTEKCYNAGDLDCVWRNYFELAEGGAVFLPHPSTHLLNFLWKLGDIDYRPRNRNYDSRWAFTDEVAKNVLKKVRREILKRIHHNGKDGTFSGHVFTNQFPVDYDPLKYDVYYSLGEYYVSAEANYFISGCYSVIVRPVYHFHDTYDWHNGKPGGGGLGGVAGFQDAWAQALQDAGKGASFDINGYWNGPNKIYGFSSNWLSLPASQNDIISEEYENPGDAQNDIFN